MLFVIMMVPLTLCIAYIFDNKFKHQFNVMMVRVLNNGYNII